MNGPAPDDPFRWLEEASSVDTVAWLAEQDERATDAIGALPAQAWFEHRLEELAVLAAGKPRVRKYTDRWLRVLRDNAHPRGVLQSKPPTDGEWTDRFDPETLGRGAVLARWDPAPDGRHVAVQLVLRGDETVTPLHVIDTATGAAIGEPTTDVRYTDLAWLDETRFVHVRASGIYLDRIGTDPADAMLLFTVPGAGIRYHLRVWHRRWLTVTARVGTASNNVVWWAALTDDGPPWTVLPLQSEPDAVTSPVVRRDGRLLVATTWGADRGRILAVGSRPTDRTMWRCLVPEDATANIGGATVVDPDGVEHLIVLRTRNGRTELTVHDVDTGLRRHAVPMPGDGTVSALSTTSDGRSCALTYTDWVTPRSNWSLDPALPLLAPARGGSGIGRRTDVRTEILHYPSTDGVEVPLTLLSPADAPPGPRPTLLTAYGGFNVAFKPSYQPEGLAWILAGGAVAVADVRGGGGRGRAWHLSGTRANKQNSFDDLHAAAEWLVATGRTRPENLVLLGASNGGLLVTGTFIQHPEAFAAAVAVAPLTDMARYELFGLGRAWAQEYGTADDPEQLRWLLGYSPYHNVRAGRRYPPLLLVTGDNDTRVDPMHARKLCAMLQFADPSGGPTLLHIVRDMGHGSNAAGHQAKLGAVTLSFLAHHGGLRPTVVGEDAGAGSAGSV